MNIIGLVGRHGRGSAGAGKSTVAKFLAEDHGYVEVALSDPMKRFLREIFAFTDDQLWGPSEMRNAPDHRYPYPEPHLLADSGDWWCKRCGESLAPGEFHVIPPEKLKETCPKSSALTPRLALQTLGTEYGRAMYEDVWINHALRMAEYVLQGHEYYKTRGATVEYADECPAGVVIADVRFTNELRRIREVGGKIWRIDRPAPGGFDEEVLHASEAGLDGETFDEIVSNEGTLEHLRELVNITMKRTAR